MRFHVFRYLSKPLDKQRFFRNLKDAFSLLQFHYTQNSCGNKTGGIFVSCFADYCHRTQGRKVIVHTARQDFDSIHNMNYWLEKASPKQFFSDTPGFIVNFEHIVDFDHSTVHLSNPQITRLPDTQEIQFLQKCISTISESMR